MRWSTIVLIAPFFFGCGGDDSGSNRTAAACGRIDDAVCAKYVECHATVAGITITSDFCTKNRSAAVSNCTTKHATDLAGASDADIDQCVTELEQTQCASICNQIPVDPPTCHKISPEPNTSSVSCP